MKYGIKDAPNASRLERQQSQLAAEPHEASQRLSDASIAELAQYVVHSGKRQKPLWLFLGADAQADNSATKLPQRSWGRQRTGNLHIAQLASQGYLQCIFTRKRDTPIEQALYAALPPQRIKLLDAAFVPRHVLKNLILQAHADEILVIQLSGAAEDPAIFDSTAANRQTQRAKSSGGLILCNVADSDVPIVRELMSRSSGPTFYCSENTLHAAIRIPGTQAHRLSPMQPSPVVPDAAVAITSFDSFFATLNLYVQKIVVDAHGKELARIEASILERHKQEQGSTEQAQEVSRIFERLEEMPHTVELSSRPWGTIEILADQEHCSARILTVHAGQRLSFQRHLCRDEFFLALDEGICIELYSGTVNPDAKRHEHDIQSIVLRKGESVLMPRGMWHRSNASLSTARLLEIAFGPYDQVMDIERRWDDYGRYGKDGSN